MTTTELQNRSQPAPHAWLLRRRGLLALALVVVALALLGVKIWRVYDRIQLVRQDARSIQAQARLPRDPAAVAALGALLAKTRGDTADLRAEAGMFLPITGLLGWVPKYGADLAAAEPLLDAAANISAAADDAFAIAGPLLAEQPSGSISGARLRERLVAAQPQLDSARAAIEAASASWRRIPLDRLSDPLRAQLAPVDQMLPLAHLGLAFAPILPDVIEDLQALEPYARTHPDKAALTALGPLLAKTRADMARLRDSAPLAAAIVNNNALGRPRDADMAAVEPLIALAADLSAAADDGYQAFAPILLRGDGSQPISVAMTEQLGATQSQLDAARQAAGRASDTLAHIQIDALSPALRDRLRPLGGMTTALADGLQLAQALPSLLGANGPADYMLLAQNPDELRATGGFIGAVGALTFDHGRHGQVSMQNSPSVDDLANQAYPDPPAPLLRYMNISMLTFRDANWSPDFPTAAKLARELYKLGQGQDIANVVAFDPYAAQLVLAAIGPVAVEGSREPITAENVLAYLRSEHDAQRGATDAKAYIGRLTSAMIAKVDTRPGEIDLWQLGLALRHALAERHVLVSLQDEATAAIIARHGWDGAVRPGAADFLMVVDMNMGYNKVNPNISESISYTVDLRDPSAPMAELTVRHRHMIASERKCQQFGDGQDTYAGWMQRCYYDYLRVLVPHGAQLVGSATQPVPGAWMDIGLGDDGAVTLGEGAAGTSELSTFLVVPFGEQRAATFRYRLPASVLATDPQGQRYRLAVQKQAGTAAIPLTVEIKLPAGARPIGLDPRAARVDSDRLRFVLSTAQDQAIDLIFAGQ